MMKQLPKLLMLLAFILPFAVKGQDYPTLPYSTGFEDVAQGALPTGWVNYATGSSSAATFPCAYHHGPNALNSSVYFEMESSSAQTEIAATCEFAEVSGLMLDFYASTTTSTVPTTFEVGVMEDSTFVPVDTVALIPEYSFGSSYYHHYRVFFDQYTGYGQRIAFRAQKNSGQYTVMIDDLTIANAPTCMSMPSNVLPLPTSYSCRVSWTAADNSLEYGIYFDGVHTPVYDTFYTLTGLSSNTTYTGYLYNICLAGDTSEWIPFTFRTECGELTLPWTEDFESGTNSFPLCWTRGQSYISYGTEYPLQYNYNQHAGNYCMTFYLGPEIAATPRIPAPINEVEMMFFYRGYTNSPLEVGYMTNPSADSTFVPVDTVYGTNGYQMYNLNFAHLEVTDSLWVAFRYHDNNYNNAYLDDLTIRQMSSCFTPENLRVISNPSGEISLRWDDTVGYAWELVYGPTGFNPDTVITNVLMGISEDSVTVTGLFDNVTYDFYVRGDCGGDYSYWSFPVTCRPNLFPMSVNGRDTIYACGGTITDDGGLTGNHYWDQTSYLYVFPDEDDKSVALSGSCDFYLTYYANLYIYEGIGESGRLLGSWDATTSNINVASTIGPLTIKFVANGYGNSYTGSGFQFDVSCNDLLACPDPYDVEVSNVAGSSAVVSWDYTSTVTPDFWNIYAIDTASGTMLTFTAADSVRSFQMTGLSQQTNYLVAVQSSCDGGDTSNAVYSSFMTNCLAGGTVQIGNGSVSLNTHPINTYYKYSYCQMLFRADELTELRDSIFGIKLLANSVSNGTYSIDIYIDTTSLSSLTSAIPMPTAKRYFHGSSLAFQAGENEFRFDSVFVRPDMNTNIVLTIDNNTGSYYSYSYWQGTGGLVGSTLYQYSDGTNVDPAVPAGVNTTDNRPNIVFLAPCADASCVAPSIAPAVPTTTSLTINWAPGNNETAWSVEYKEASDNTWIVNDANTTATSTVITGLTGNTVYDIRVSSLCGDTSASSTIQARTNCVAISSLPYTQDFENFVASTSSYNGTNDFEPCWHRSPNFVSYGSVYVYPYLYSTAHSGSKSMYLHGSTYDGYRSYMVLPEFTMGIDSLILSCWNYGGSSYDVYELQVGVMTDPTDISTFVPVDTITYNTIGAWAYNEVEFLNYTGTGRYIAFYCGANHNGGLLVDDIIVNYNSSCRRVQSSSISNVTMTTADIAFVDTNNVGDYTIFWGTDDNFDNATDSLNVFNSPATITGLTTAEVYNVWIRTNCAYENSLIYNVGQFATVCAPTVINATHSLFEGFEGDAPVTCWIYRDPTTVSNRIEHNSDDQVEGSQSLRFSSYNYASTYDAYVITPELVADSAMQLSFSYKSYSTYNLETFRVGYSTTTTDDTAFTWEATVTAPASWNRYETFIPANAKYVAIHYNTPGCYYYLYVDSLVIELAPTCVKPDNVTITNVTGVSARVSWNALTPAPAYEVQYRTTGLPWSSVIAYADSAYITGLNNLSTYSVRVRCICAPGDTSYWSDIVEFQTEMCDNPTIALNYDEATASMSTTSYMPAYSYYNYGYSEVLVDAEYLQGITDITAFAFETANNTAGTYYNNCDIYFGLTTDSVLTNWHYDSTFVHVFHGDLNYTDAGWQIFSLDTTFTYDGTSNLIVAVNRLDGRYLNGSTFVSHTTNGNHGLYYYDDYDPCDMTNFSSMNFTATNNVANYKFINCNAGCAAPAIIAETHDYETATINWTGAGSSYEVNIKETAAATWPADIAVTGNTYTFTGLNAATYYTIRVRQDCTVDELGYSAWTETIILTDSLPCLTPSALVATNITNAEATIDWTTNGTESNWDIHVWFAGGFDSIYRVSAHPATVSGFTAGVTYNVAVRALCGSALLEGDWSDAITFTTAICPDVTGLATSNVAAHSIDLSWAANPMAQSWIVEYGFHGFNQGTGTVITANTNSCHITGLADETAYDFNVRAVCGNDWTSEGWTSISATTQASSGNSYYVTVLSNDASMGSVSGEGQYEAGETATLTATPNAGYEFVSWNDGITDNPRYVVVVSDSTFTATFRAVQQSIDGADGQLSCTIYPNPATSTTTISVEGANGMVRIVVVDINGRAVASETIECSTDCAKTIDIDALAQGAYFVRITGENINMVKKLIVR